jgi:hypothetical protein
LVGRPDGVAGITFRNETDTAENAAVLAQSNQISIWTNTQQRVIVGANGNVTINAPSSGAHSISGTTNYTPTDGPSNVEIGFRRVPKTTDTTLNTAKVAQCIAVTAGVTIPASVYAAGDSFSIYNDSSSSITLTQGSGLTLRQSGTSNTGNRTLAARGMATIWFNSATEAIVMGDVT